MFFDLNRYTFSQFIREARALAALAAPMAAAQTASIAVSVADTVMAGAAGKTDLTAVALGSSVFATVFITLIGVMAALNPIISQLHGAGKTAEVGAIGQQGMWFGAAIGTAGMLLMTAAVPLLQHYLDLGSEVERQFAVYLYSASAAMPAAMIYRALHAYASSLNRPKPVMWINWAMLLLNILLNYLFIFGKFGIPRMGGAGAGVATAIVFWVSAAALYAYVVRTPYFQPFGLNRAFRLPETAAFKQIWHIGWASGFSYFLEASLFTAVVWLVAPLGANYVAAQQIILSLSGVLYILPQSVGAAATVRIGYALGRRQLAHARYIAGVSLASGCVLAAVTVVVLLPLRRALASAYTADVQLVEITATLLIFAALYQLFDFLQCIASYALRGYKITRVPMLIHIAAFWLVGLGLGYTLAYGAGMGIYGFWAALIAALAGAAAALVWYLEQCSRNMLRR